MPLMMVAPNVGKSMLIPSSNSSSEITISLFFGLLSKVLNSSEVLKETRYSCTNLEEINTSAGRFNSYKYSIDSPNDGESEFFYAPAVNNVIRFFGGDTEIFTYSGELISTNVQ